MNPLLKLTNKLVFTFLLALSLCVTAFAAAAANGPKVTDHLIIVGDVKNNTYSNAETWPVFCEPDGKVCNLGGKSVGLSYLSKKMPVATWGYCSGLFCYGNEAQSDVLGLNPMYFE